jgi:hypothetical protein
MEKVIRQFIALSALICTSLLTMQGQPLSSSEPIPDGAVVYSLPSTALHLEVEALREFYSPGPYAQYANKYLGLDVSQAEETKFQLLSIKMTPYVEADGDRRYSINLVSNSRMAPANFFKITSQGLIILSDQYKGHNEYWRFPTLADNFEIDPNAATDNITSAKTTLYKNVKTASGSYEKVAVQQSQVVEKSLERKAQEAANTIFNIRKKRVEIVTGDTDVTFSGEAMTAVIEQMNKIEEEYLSLFIGKRESAVEKMNFDVIPQSSNENQLYVAFRLSDTHGLLPPSDVSGRPIVMQLEVEKQKGSAISENDARKAQSGKGVIFYREPAIALVKIADGKDLLFQQRVPIYQLGQLRTFPIESLIK